MKFLLSILLLFAGANAWAQLATGSLGEPIYTFDFGSGSDPSPFVTGYTFVTGSCPNDGQYGITKAARGCHDDIWHKVLKDHTGNNGYMMVVNADEVQGKVFFQKQLLPGTLCGNTTYEFSSYIINLVKAGQTGFIKPRVSFRIEKLDGTLLSAPYEVEIQETPDPTWVKYATYFVTPPDVSEVVIKLVNTAPGGYGNDLILDDIAFRAFGPVVQAGVIDINGKIDTNTIVQCSGIAKTYNLKSQVTNNPDYRYQWQERLNYYDEWRDIPLATTLSFDRDFTADAPAGVYQYRLGVALGSNINMSRCRVYSDPFNIKINPTPVAPAPSILSVCEGEAITLTASGAARYRWTLPGMTVTSQNPVSIPNAIKANEGRYMVELISAAGCSSFSYIDVVVNSKPLITVNPLPPVCKGNNTQLSVTVDDASLYNYEWLPAIGLSNNHVADPMASPDKTTLYKVTVTNKLTGCTSTGQVNVSVLNLPVANAGIDKKVFKGQSVKLGSGSINDVTYSWLPADYLDDPHAATPVATPPFDINYSLTVTSVNGCGVITDDVFVKVYDSVTIPSSFTPNDDGVNDTWNIAALSKYPESVINIYNRNGKQVFQSRGYSKPWDGKINGDPLPVGTYYYIINMNNADIPKLSGWVLLVR